MNTVHQRSFGQGFEADPQHRLFFGIWPSPGTANRLTRLMARLRYGGLKPGRPVQSNRLHATLQHLGDFADQIPPRLISAARAAAATVKIRPFKIAFDRFGGTKGQLLLPAFDGSVAWREFRQTLSFALI